MSSHVHLMMSTSDKPMEHILRDLKRYTSRKITQAIMEDPQESRKEWMLWMFERAGKRNPNNDTYQFWQQNNHPVELWSNEAIKRNLDYIHNNPVEAGFSE